MALNEYIRKKHRAISVKERNSELNFSYSTYALQRNKLYEALLFMTKMCVSDSQTVTKWLQTLEKHLYNAIEILPMTL